MEAAAPADAGEATPFPFEIGGPFELVDHRGRRVTEREYLGSHLLVFFGYAQCRSICPVALERMAAALDLLGAAGAGVQPLLITVDPAHDDIEALARRVAEVHPRLIGLTGSRDALDAAAKAYRVETEARGTSLKGTPIFSHGSYIYLMGPDGKFATLLPPVMGAEQMASIIGRYL